MILSIATVSGYGYTQIPATALGNASARTRDAAADAESASNVIPRNLPFLATRVAFDNDINRFVLQFRNSKDGEVTGQIPAGKSSSAYREAQRLRGENPDKTEAEAKAVGEKKTPGEKTDEGAATIGDGKAPPPVTIGATGGGGATEDGADTVISIGGSGFGSSGFGGSTPAPSAVSSYSPPAPATQSSGRGTTA